MSEPQQKTEPELAVFWEEIAQNLPKSIERSALGDEKIFLAFKIAYPKIKSYLLHTSHHSILDEAVERIGKNKIAGGNYNCGEEGCCEPNPTDERELEDVDFQCGYNQCIKDVLSTLQELKSEI